MNELMKKILNKETILYIIFGVITTIVDFAAFAVFHYGLDMNEILANITINAINGAPITII